MPETLGSLQDVFKTMHSVPDGSLIVVDTVDLRQRGTTNPKPTWGFTVLSKEKKAVFVSAKRFDAATKGKFHSKSFVHELGHYTGISGHPIDDVEGPGQPDDALDDEKLIMYTGLSPRTGNFEPWFSVAATEGMRDYFEGQIWSSFSQRKFPPPGVLPNFDGVLASLLFDSASDFIAMEVPW